jgi:peptide/nickel transport system ATP-binding protein
LVKYFPSRDVFSFSFFSKKKLFVRAVDKVSFDINKGEIFVLAGESGCGKSTTGRLVVRLIEPTGGEVIFDKESITSMSMKALKSYRRRAQMIFQDPYQSLDPRQTVYDAMSEPLKIHHLVDGKSEEKDRIIETLRLVKLVPPEEYVHRFPHQLSGGQRQRVAIARAMVVKPEFIVADEPVSMVDVSIRADILNSLLDLRNKFSLAILLITHDLAVASYMADRIGIMYLGKILEIGPTDKVVSTPLNPYTQALTASVPSSDPIRKRRGGLLKGEPPSPINPPSGCRFHPRCPHVEEKCKKEAPMLAEEESRHFVACFLYQR